MTHNKLNVNSIILNDNVENKYRYNEKIIVKNKNLFFKFVNNISILLEKISSL